MKNSHLRFGWLTYYRRTEKTTTHFKLRLDRFVGEMIPDPPRRAQAHLISVIGSDTQIAAVQAAISMEEQFSIEGPNLAAVNAFLGRDAHTYKGSIQLPDRKKPVRHLIGASRELSQGCTAPPSGRVLIVHSGADFQWSILARRHGLPVVPEWAAWFDGELKKRNAVIRILGIGCDPVLVRGSKEQFLKWISQGLKQGTIRFPDKAGCIHWPTFTLSQIFHSPIG